MLLVRSVIREYCLIEDNGLEEHIAQVRQEPFMLASAPTSQCLRQKRSLQLFTCVLRCGLQLQSRLLDIGAHLATPLSSSSAKQIARMEFDDEEVAQLERWIDKVTRQQEARADMQCSSIWPLIDRSHVPLALACLILSTTLSCPGSPTSYCRSVHRPSRRCLQPVCLH